MADERDRRGRPTAGDVTLTVETPDGETHELSTESGAVLRDVLLESGLSPHSRYAVANCGGRGICATCGVRLADPPAPEHWHDDLADRFGYPRLACQIRVRDGMSVRIPDKRVWGGRERDDVGENEGKGEDE